LATQPEKTGISEDSNTQQKTVLNATYSDKDISYDSTENHSWHKEPFIDTSEAYNILSQQENILQETLRRYKENFSSDWFHPGKELSDKELEVSNVYAEQELDTGKITYRFRNYRKEDGRYTGEINIEVEAENMEKALYELENLYNSILENSGSEELCIENLKIE